MPLKNFLTRNSIKIATVSYGVRNIVTLVEVGGKRLKRGLQRQYFGYWSIMIKS